MSGKVSAVASRTLGRVIFDCGVCGAGCGRRRRCLRSACALAVAHAVLVISVAHPPVGVWFPLWVRVARIYMPLPRRAFPSFAMQMLCNSNTSSAGATPSAELQPVGRRCGPPLGGAPVLVADLRRLVCCCLPAVPPRRSRLCPGHPRSSVRAVVRRALHGCGGAGGKR